ncbi:hypothetical protein AAMO2058_000575700 [Amorphochlora amoebiformis]
MSVRQLHVLNGQRSVKACIRFNDAYLSRYARDTGLTMESENADEYSFRESGYSEFVSEELDEACEREIEGLLRDLDVLCFGNGAEYEALRKRFTDEYNKQCEGLTRYSRMKPVNYVAECDKWRANFPEFVHPIPQEKRKKRRTPQEKPLIAPNSPASNPSEGGLEVLGVRAKIHLSKGGESEEATAPEDPITICQSESKRVEKEGDPNEEKFMDVLWNHMVDTIQTAFSNHLENPDNHPNLNPGTRKSENHPNLTAGTRKSEENECKHSRNMGGGGKEDTTHTVGQSSGICADRLPPVEAVGRRVKRMLSSHYNSQRPKTSLPSIRSKSIPSPASDETRPSSSGNASRRNREEEGPEPARYKKKQNSSSTIKLQGPSEDGSPGYLFDYWSRSKTAYRRPYHPNMRAMSLDTKKDPNSSPRLQPNAHPQNQPLNPPHQSTQKFQISSSLCAKTIQGQFFPALKINIKGQAVFPARRSRQIG